MSETSETFTNEDHLSSHQKRHEMSLLLPGGITISRSNSLTLGADLTPTPTRFIRIGEEVGLFQDLLKANPFDEQFRKAAEQNKAASVNLPLPFSGSCDEPLNTPHIVHPGEGEHHPAKGGAAPAVDTPQPRLASPHRLGIPPPAHLVVTPCSPLRSRGGAPPAHRDPLDPDGGIDIDDDMEVEGPLDMRSPSVIPPVSETLISPSVIQTPGGSLTSPPVIHTPGGSLSSPPVIHGPGSLPHPAGSLGSPHTGQTPVSGAGLASPPPSHTPTTLQSSAVSSTVAIPRHHQLSVPPLRPRPVASTGPAPHPASLPAAHTGTLTGPLPGTHTAVHSGVHSAVFSGAHQHSGMLSGALQGSLPAQASQPAAMPAHQSSHPAPPPGQLPDPVALSSDGVEFQIKLSNGHVIPLSMHPDAAAAARVPGGLVTPPAGTPVGAAATTAAGNEMAAAAVAGAPSTVRERLKRSLQRPAVSVPPAAAPPPPPPADAQPPLPLPRTSQSEDSLRKERNRAAANRWRARKKRAQQQMASSMEALNCTVNELRHENAELRSQLTKLKLILAQHRDCDVSRGLKPPAEVDAPSRLEMDDLSRLMGSEPVVSAPAGAGMVSPAEEVRRVATTSSVPLVFSSGPAVSTLPVPSAATHQLILLQPAPAGGPRQPQPQLPQQQQQQQQQAAPVRQYRLPTVSPAGRLSLHPPLKQEDRL